MKSILNTNLTLMTAIMTAPTLGSCEDQAGETAKRPVIETPAMAGIGEALRTIDIGIDDDALTLLGDLALSGASGRIEASDILMLLTQSRSETPGGTPTVNLEVTRGDAGLVRVNVSGRNLHGVSRPRNARVNMILLDALRAEVEISDLPLFTESLRRADDNKHDATLFKAEVAAASGTLSASRVTMGDSIAPGEVRLGCFRDEFSGEWYWMPTMTLADGTSYAPIEGFASESNLRVLRSMAEITFGSYNNLLDPLDQ